MASQKIDELQLQISSDATTAITQLENLASALDRAAASATSLSRANGALNVFAISLERIAGANLSRAVENLTALSKMDFSNLKNKTIDLRFNVNGASEAERRMYATQDAVKDVSKEANKMASALGQKYNVDTDGIKDLATHYRALTQALAENNGPAASSAMYSIFDTIVQHGRMSLAEIQGVKEEFQREYDSLKKIVAGTNGLSQSEIESLAGKGFLGNLKKGATGIDANWAEIVGENQQALQSLGNTSETTSDQLTRLAERLQYLREMLEPKGITDGNLIDDIAYSAQQAVDQTQSVLDNATNKHMRESVNKVQLDIVIDDKAIERQIQSAINKATSKTFTTNPIKLKIDDKQLRNSVEAAFSLIDIAKLPQYSKGFTDVANAISTMNQANLKATGINQFTNSMRRLMSVDTSKFDIASFKKITDVIASMTQLGGIDKTINRFVTAMTKLSETGYKSKLVADGLKKLGPVLEETVKRFIGIGTIDGKINQFISGIANLANAGATTSVTAQNLDDLSKAVLRFLNTLGNAPQINTNLAMTIQGLGNLAAAGQKTSQALTSVNNAGGMDSILTSALGKAAKSVTNDLKGLLGIAQKLGTAGVKSLGAFMQKLGLLPSASSGIDRTALSFSNLLRTILPFYGIRGLFDWAKEAFAAGSSITEVENVINTSFGNLKKGYEDISGYVYDWAKTTIDAFGVSELAAKQYAGRLMAMFNSSGFDFTEGMRDSAAKMTTDLIERAGDVASFYDIGVDEAMTKFQAGLAGQVRPLRALGINMSVANMEAFAMSQGINTAWKEMDQASQMALRYQYILYATQYAEGDFGRTSMSAANQVRLLQLNTQMLTTTLGQGLISAIAPVISWLNALIKRLIQAANAFRVFMWTLFGKPLAAAKGVVNELAGYLDDASDSASSLGDAGGGASDGLGGASDAAKELKKNLSVLPFDELNQLAKDTSSASSGGSGGGGGGGTGGLGDLGLTDLGDIDIDSSPTIEAINRWAAKIREAFEKQQWSKLGRIVAEGINAGFEFIYDVLDWEKIKPKVVDGFIVPFQEAFNSMMAWIDWDLVGRTFGRGLNDVTYTLRAWITGFEWRKYGAYFAEGLNSLINTWDADAFGRLIADKFKMAWDWFGGWVETFDFSSLGGKLKIGFRSFFDELDPADMGKTLANFLNGISDTIISFFSDEKVVGDVSDAFSEFVNNFLNTLDADKIASAINTITDAITKTLSESIKKIDKEELGRDLGTILQSLPWTLIGGMIAAKAGATLATSIFAGSIFKSVTQRLLTKSITEALANAGITGGAGASASTAAGAGAAGAGAGLSAGAAVAGTGIMGGLMALGIAMRKFADEHGGVQKGSNLTVDQSFGTTQTAPTNQNAAGNYTSVQTAPITAPQSTQKVTQVIETLLTGKKDQTFAQLELAKAALLETPVVKKIMDGSLTNLFKEGYEKFTDTKLYNVIKNFGGSESGGFLDKFSKYIYTKSHNVTKWFNGSDGGGFMDKFSKYIYTKTHNVTKTFYGKDGGSFLLLYNKFISLKDKVVKLTFNIITTAKSVVANIIGKGKEILANIWTENAKGGLFTEATGFQVFGEAGDEAAIPLERKSTMKRIANAIVESGGMSTGNNDELANEIAARIAPIIVSAVTGQNERPINVNATLYTENNEVLARAVNSGNRSLDKRYNPVPQFGY